MRQHVRESLPQAQAVGARPVPPAHRRGRGGQSGLPWLRRESRRAREVDSDRSGIGPEGAGRPASPARGPRSGGESREADGSNGQGGGVSRGRRRRGHRQHRALRQRAAPDAPEKHLPGLPLRDHHRPADPARVVPRDHRGHALGKLHLLFLQQAQHALPTGGHL